MEYSSLPKQVQDQAAKNSAVEKYRALLAEAKEAFERLAANKDLRPLPLTLEGLTSGWVERIANNKIVKVDSLDYLTEEQREAQKSLINQWRQCVMDDVVILSKFRDSVPADGVGYDNGTGPFITDINALADSDSMLMVPALANKHWAKVQRVFAAIDELRDFEKDNMINSITLQNLAGAKSDPDKFAMWWAVGVINPDARIQQLAHYRRQDNYL